MENKEEVKEKDSKTVETVKNNGGKAAYMLMGAGITFAFLILLFVGIFAVAHITHRNLLQESKTAGVTFNREFDFSGPGKMLHGGGRFAMNNVTNGKVTEVNGQTFTVDDSGTNVKVQITSDTRFPVKSATSVKTGDQVNVWGEKDSTGVVQAERIVVNP